MFRFLTICATLALIGVAYGKLSNVPIPDDMKDTVFDLRDACMKRLGMSMDAHDKLEFDESRATKCYLSCIMEEANWMHRTTGEIRYEAIDEHKIRPDEDKLQVYKDNCPHQPEGDNCEKAYIAVACYRSHHMDSFWFP